MPLPLVACMPPFGYWVCLFRLLQVTMLLNSLVASGLHMSCINNTLFHASPSAFVQEYCPSPHTYYYLHTSIHTYLTQS